MNKGKKNISPVDLPGAGNIVGVENDTPVTRRY